MKIEVARVSVHRGNLEVIFRGGDNWSDTPEGVRAFRILTKHVHGGGYSIRGPVVSLGGGANAAAVNTLKACQAEMDRFANQSIAIQYQQPKVHVTDGKELFTNLTQVRQAQRDGHQVVASLRVRTTLPILDRDREELQDVLRVGAYPVDSDVNQMALVAYLMGSREKADPWQLLRSFRPQIQKVIK